MSGPVLPGAAPGARTEAEILSQPDLWPVAAALGRRRPSVAALAAPGERVLAIGCGTSAFVALAYAHLREAAGLGWTDHAYASELAPSGRAYDRVVAFSRSGTTTEVLDAFGRLAPAMPRTVVTAVPDTPLGRVADDLVDLSFADEVSVVQTRFPTAALVAARAATGELDDAALDRLVAQGRAALEAPLPPDLGTPEGIDHVVYLGTGWALGVAHEAALKVREAALAWSESYPSSDYRHGPVAVAGPRTLVTMLGAVPEGLVDDIASTGAQVRVGAGDPVAELVLAQRLALALGRARGTDPDAPRFLTRSVVLERTGVGP